MNRFIPPALAFAAVLAGSLDASGLSALDPADPYVAVVRWANGHVERIRTTTKLGCETLLAEIRAGHWPSIVEEWGVPLTIECVHRNEFYPGW